jgi:hypothetical protein
VEVLERQDRAAGVSEVVIASRREAREIKEEENMIDEVTGRSKTSDTRAVLPTNFRANLMASKGQSSRNLTARILANSGQK